MDLARLERLLGHHFRDARILHQALTHRSAGSLNNERLEFLGDAILGFEVAENLFRQHPSATEGQLSRARAQLVKRETLAKIARRLNLGDYLILGPGELRSGGQNRDSILSDTIEALIAAVYLDAGIDAARQLVRDLLHEELAQIVPEAQHKDAKTLLQEYLQARGLELPQYRVETIAGSAHQQRFTVSCRVDALRLEEKGQGNSRRKAEQEAAGRMLKRLEAAQ